MPRGDGTGPRGMGAMTGRQAGYCAGAGMPANPLQGRGFGIGFGRGCGGRGGFGFGNGGRGLRHGFYATGQPGWMRSHAAPYGYPTPYQNQKPDPALEKQALKKQAEALQSELDFIKKRLDESETLT